VKQFELQQKSMVHHKVMKEVREPTKVVSYRSGMLPVQLLYLYVFDVKSFSDKSKDVGKCRYLKH